MKKLSGFTLIELMVTLAIAGILITVAVPGFQSLIASNRLTAQTNNLVTAFHQARSEAIKRSTSVMVSAIDSSDGSNEWGKGGFRVWVDLNSDGNYDAGEELQTYAALPSSMTLENDDTQYSYNSAGRLSDSGNFQLCDDRTGETGRQITVTLIGRVSSDSQVCP